MGSRQNYQRILLEACNIAGDETILAARLGQPVGKTVNWLLGSAPVPIQVFLQAVDIVSMSGASQLNDVSSLLKDIRIRHAL